MLIKYTNTIVIIQNNSIYIHTILSYILTNLILTLHTLKQKQIILIWIFFLD
jgi:hypothetical protein